MRLTSSFPNAPQPDVVLAAQKDKSYETQVVAAVEEAVQQLLSRGTALRFKREIQFLGEMLYHLLTSGSGLQTLGEEYCFIHKVTECGKMPSSLRRGCFVVSKVVVPYVIDHLSKQQILLHLYPAPARSEESRSDSTTDSAIIKFGQFVLTSWSTLRSWCQRHSESIQKSVEFIKRCQMAFFYVFGSYYLISHSVAGIKLFNIDGRYQRVPQYYLLGVFLLLQLLITPLIEGDRILSASAPESLPLAVIESDGRIAERPAESSVSGEIQQSFASKCPLCLGVCTHATSASCGHVFCWKCIAEWVQEKEECPLCRTDTRLSSLVPIYHADF